MSHRQKFLVMALCLVSFSQIAISGEGEVSYSQPMQAVSHMDPVAAEQYRQAEQEENQRVTNLRSKSRWEQLKSLQLFRNSVHDTSKNSMSLSEFFAKKRPDGVIPADSEAVRLNWYNRMKQRAVDSSAVEKSTRLKKHEAYKERKNKDKELEKKAKKSKMSEFEKNDLVTRFKKGEEQFANLHGSLTQKDLNKMVGSLTNDDLNNMSTSNLRGIMTKYDDENETHLIREGTDFKNWQLTHSGQFKAAPAFYKSLLIREVQEIQRSKEIQKSLQK